MWYKDTAGHMNDLGYENVGSTKRRNLIANEMKVDMTGYIHDDVFRQTRILPTGVTVSGLLNSVVSSGPRLGTQRNLTGQRWTMDDGRWTMDNGR